MKIEFLSDKSFNITTNFKLELSFPAHIIIMTLHSHYRFGLEEFLAFKD